MPSVSPWLGPVAPDIKPTNSIVTDLSWGLNDKLPGQLIPDNAIQSGQNMYYKDGLVLTTRIGKTNYNAVSIAASKGIRGLFPYYKNDGNRYLIICSGTSIYQGNAGVPTKLTGADGLGLTSNLNYSAVQFGDSLFLVNGTDAMVKVSATTASAAGGSPPLATMIVEHKNMVFSSGDSANPNNIRWSAIGDPETWPAANVLAVVTNDGDPVTALVSFGDSLIIFKNTKTYALEGAGTTTFNLRRISTSFGCAGPWATQESDDFLFFLDAQKPRMAVLDKGYGFTDISTDRIPKACATFNVAQLGQAVVSYYKEMIIFNVPTGTSTFNNFRYVYDLNNKAWCPKWTNGYSHEILFNDGSSFIYYSGHSTEGAIFVQGLDDKDAAVPATAIYPATALPAASVPVWTKLTGGTATETITAGKLVLDITGTGYIGYVIADTQLSNSVGTTLEGKCQVVSNPAFNNTNALTIWDGTRTAVVQIIDEAVYLNSAVYAMDTSTAEHKYRLTLKANISKLYVDDVLVLTGTGTTSATAAAVQFGDNVSGGDSHSEKWDDVQYWRSGAFAPNVESINDAAIFAKFRTKDFNLGVPFNKKRHRKLWVEANLSGSSTQRRLPVNIYINYALVDVTSLLFNMPATGLWGTFVWGVGVWGSGINKETARARFRGQGKTVSFEFFNDEPNQAYTVYSFEWTSRIKDAR